MALDEGGQVWGWGDNSYGQLGKKNKKNRKELPKTIDYFIKKDINVVKVSCGFHHNLALDDCGRVYAWGGMLRTG